MKSSETMFTMFSVVLYLLCSWIVQDVACYLVYKGELNPPCKRLDGLRLHEMRACKGYLLIHAIRKGRIKEAKSLLDDERDAPYVVAFKDKSVNTYGYTALIWAAKENYTELVKLLVQKNARVNYASAANYTALYYCVKNRNKECSALLLSEGADPNIIPTEGNSPLLEAVWNDCFDTAKLLLDNEADSDSMTEGSNYFPLYFASKKGNLKMVNELLKRKAAVNLQTSWNITALMIASTYGHTAVVKALLTQEADPNMKDNQHLTPLHKAAYYGYLDILKILLAKGAEINAVDLKNSSALHYSSREGQRDIVKELVKYCPDDKIRNTNERTPIEDARYMVDLLQNKLKKPSKKIERLKNIIAVLEGYKSSSCRRG